MPLFCAGTLITHDCNRLVLSAIKLKDRKAIGFPCGKIARGESPLVAAVRETKEETGLEVKLTLDNAFSAKDDLGNYVSIYRAHVVGGSLKWRTKECECAWARPEDLCKGLYKDFNIACLKYFGLLS
jgi:8-oxo-dGTP pyrophosphatase MutT (NUDIX family)